MSRQDNFKFFGLLLTVILTAFTSASAQDGGLWFRFESEDKKFSFILPKNLQLFSDPEVDQFMAPDPITKNSKSFKFGDSRFFTGSASGSSFLVRVHKADSIRTAVSMLRGARATNERELAVSFKGVESAAAFIVSTDRYYGIRLYFGQNDQVYEVLAWAVNEKNDSLRVFLNNLKFNGKTVFALVNSSSPTIDQGTKSIRSEPDTHFSLEFDDVDNKDSSTSTSAESKDGNPLFLLLKVRGEYTRDARQHNEIGNVKLRVTFASDGSAGRVALIGKGLKHGLIDAAVRAARQMRFFPKEKSGVPISTTRIVSFDFDLFK